MKNEQSWALNGDLRSANGAAFYQPGAQRASRATPQEIEMTRRLALKGRIMAALQASQIL